MHLTLASRRSSPLSDDTEDLPSRPQRPLDVSGYISSLSLRKRAANEPQKSRKRAPHLHKRAIYLISHISHLIFHILSPQESYIFSPKSHIFPRKSDIFPPKSPVSQDAGDFLLRVRSHISFLTCFPPQKSHVFPQKRYTPPQKSHASQDAGNLFLRVMSHIYFSYVFSAKEPYISAKEPYTVSHNAGDFFLQIQTKNSNFSCMRES